MKIKVTTSINGGVADIREHDLFGGDSFDMYFDNFEAKIELVPESASHYERELNRHDLTSTLTKREQFAMAAIQGWLARCANVPHTHKLESESMAEVAVSMADALIKELDK